MAAKRKKGGRRAGAGRKPAAAHVKQRHHVTITLTDAELATLDQVTGDEPRGSYARRVLLRHLSRRKK